MVEAIELTAEERQAARLAYARSSVPNGISGRDNIADWVVDLVVDAVNRHRVGDPVGTLYKNDLGTRIYERVITQTGERCWMLYKRIGPVWTGLPENAQHLFTPDSKPSFIWDDSEGSEDLVEYET